MENRSLKDYGQLFLKGLGMGAADVVPGVSGGTIAFITGIYEELIGTIKNIHINLFKIWAQEGFKAFWKAANGSFLLTLLTGIGVSILSLASLIKFLLENYEVLVWAFFFGLILASALVIGRNIKQWGVGTITSLIIGAAIGFAITVLAPATTPETNVFVFFSGAIAICAMILPGISGSFLLLLMGKYQFIITGLIERNLQVIFFFGAGAVVGLLSFSRVLSWMFKKHYQLTISFLTGIMVGSLNKVWPWKITLESVTNRHGELVPIKQKNVWPAQFDGEAFTITSIGLILLGIAIVMLMEWKPKKKVEAEL
jgi:putative membrane protein